MPADRLRALLIVAIACIGLAACAAGGGGFQSDGVDFGGNGQSHGHP